MIRELYYLAGEVVGNLFFILLAVLFGVLMLPTVLIALAYYFCAGVFKSKDEKKLVATKIAKWRWADIYTRAVEKLTGNKF